MDGGVVELDFSLVEGCIAQANDSRGSGGGIFLDRRDVGSVKLRDGSRLLGNEASDGVSGTMDILGGSATYLLPAPPGHWIAALLCEVYREACEMDGKGAVLNSTCEDTREDCRFKADEEDQRATVNGTACQKPLINQVRVDHAPCWPQMRAGLL